MFASIVEGDFGPVPDMLNKMAQAALSDTEKGVETVMSILRAPGGAEETMRLDMRPFDLSTLVFEVVDGLRASIVQKGLELRIQIEPKRIVVGDAQKIAHMVVRNLVENAIHYTASGSISVNVKSTGKTALLTVSDTGVGIGKKDMERLFTKGGHGHDSLSMNRDSTGYGLFIAQQVMKAHGGKISVESEGEGKGSRFTTEFPLSS
jgi:signal transduction histidine kinase